MHAIRQDLEPDLVAGRYALFQSLGRGKTAEVFLAADDLSRSLVAFKHLLPEFAERDDVARRFTNEARAMAAIRHWNVLEVLDIGLHERRPFIVMEYAAGGTLGDRVKRSGPLPPRAATLAALDLAKAASAVHTHGVVHRDIKPHNVLITHTGVCRLTDFGLAQLDDDHETLTGMQLGTVGFMAPEQRFDAKDVDARADVYSVAATLFYLLTGRVKVDMFRAAGNRPEILDGLPPVLADVITRCVAFDRNKRLASGEQLVDALGAALHELGPDPENLPPLFEVGPDFHAMREEWPGPLRTDTSEAVIQRLANSSRIVPHTPLLPSQDDVRTYDEPSQDTLTFLVGEEQPALARAVAPAAFVIGALSGVLALLLLVVLAVQFL